MKKTQSKKAVVQEKHFLQKLIAYKEWWVLLAVLLLFLFLRLYQLEYRGSFGWDQANMAWAAKSIIDDHNFPLLGMVAKENSGIYIGPAVYYINAIPYMLFNMDPIAAQVYAVMVSTFGIFILYFVLKRLFTKEVALIAVIINTVAVAAINFDRVPWPVLFIPAVSLLVFYALYKIVMGGAKYLLLLATVIGFSVHVHFTSIFYPIFVLLALPFFPRRKETLKYILFAIPFFAIWLIPNALYMVQHPKAHAGSFMSYAHDYYHGFHLRRVFQIIQDGFIQFEPYLLFSWLKPLKFVLLPLLTLYMLLKHRERKSLMLVYLMWVWFIVPWFIFATYKGEISDYYFAVNRFIALTIIAYLLAVLWNLRKWYMYGIVTLMLIAYGIYNVHAFLLQGPNDLYSERQDTLKAVAAGRIIGYQEGVPESYIYYYYTHHAKPKK